MDQSNELDQDVRVTIQDWKHDSKPSKWEIEIEFELAHGQLAGLSAGQTYVFDAATSGEGDLGVLGLAGVFDFSNEDDYCCEAPTWYELTIESIDESDISATLLAEFENGVQLRPPEDVEEDASTAPTLGIWPWSWATPPKAKKTYLKVRGMQLPSAGSGGDDGPWEMTCESYGVCVFYHLTSQEEYDLFVSECGPNYVGTGNLCSGPSYCEFAGETPGSYSRVYVETDEPCYD